MSMRKSLVLITFPLLAWVACGDDATPATTTGTGGNTTVGSGGSDATVGTGGSGGSVGSGGEGGGENACGDAAIYGAQGAMNTAECTACIDANCCDQRAACSDDAACLSFRDCAGVCSVLDTPCQDACIAAAGSVPATSSALASCRNSSCSAECANLACFGNQVWPAPSVTDYTIEIMVGDFSSGAPVADVEVKVCDKADVTCQTPLATYTSDAEGKLTATFPAAPEGFGAYVELNGPGLVPTIHHFLTADPAKTASLGRGLAAVPVMLFDTLASLAQVTIDPARGHLVMTARDCGDYGLADVAASADTQDAQSKLIFLVNGLPNTTNTGTDRSGRVNIINVPAGPATVTGTYVPTGEVYSTYSLDIRAGYLNSFTMVPTP